MTKPKGGVISVWLDEVTYEQFVNTLVPYQTKSNKLKEMITEMIENNRKKNKEVSSNRN